MSNEELESCKKKPTSKNTWDHDYIKQDLANNLIRSNVMQFEKMEYEEADTGKYEGTICWTVSLVIVIVYQYNICFN